ncbi:MAG TPA: 4-hydroxy-tetrahydrodipicolinate synthase [Actinomycetota bacterium]|nr:4-hydroxy-tetrahydrodipicolinate synthase [Actinomycetota bacterium]
MPRPRFGRVLTAMVTPFAADGTLDVKAARRLAGHLVTHGSDGLVVCGTTGESPTLSHAEKLELIEAVLAEVGDRATVIAGTGTYDTSESVSLTKEVCALGVDGCLAVTPYYSKPPQEGLLAHFRAIADASDKPVMLYDIPGRTGRRIEPSTTLALADHERIVAVKDAVGDAGETAYLRCQLDLTGHEGFEIYSGDDPLLLPHLAAGAVGIVSVCSHLVGERLAELFGHWEAGRVDEARSIYTTLLPFMRTIMTASASPIPVKAAVNMLGLDVGEPRLPLVPLDADTSDEVRRALEAQGLL